MNDSVTLAAPQSASNAVLIPCAIGWALQLFLGGIATSQAFQILRKRRRYFTHHKTDGYLLKSALGTNLLVTGLVFWSSVAWTSTQERGTEGLLAYKKPDAVWPVCSALVSCITQAYMARRCYKLVRHCLWFLLLMSALILAAFAGSVWSTAAATLFALQKGGDDAMFVPTQIWLWSSVVIDVLITAALSFHLSSMKQGFSKDTDNFINAIIRVGFETCAAPLFFTIVSAIAYVATRNSHLLWNLYAVTASFLPAVYLISFVYCVEATHTSKEVYESSRSADIPHPNDVEKGNNPSQPRGALAIPVNNVRNTQHSISWAPPLDWQSVPGDPEPVLLLSETPFAKYASADSDDSTDSSSAEEVKRPVTGISIAIEKHVQVDYEPAPPSPDDGSQ